MTTTFKLLKYECSSCAIVIEGICEEMPGVEKVQVKLREQLVIVEHGERTPLSVLAKALAKKGYPVELQG